MKKFMVILIGTFVAIIAAIASIFTVPLGPLIMELIRLNKTDLSSGDMTTAYNAVDATRVQNMRVSFDLTQAGETYFDGIAPTRNEFPAATPGISGEPRSYGSLVWENNNITVRGVP